MKSFPLKFALLLLLLQSAVELSKAFAPSSIPTLPACHSSWKQLQQTSTISGSSSATILKVSQWAITEGMGLADKMSVSRGLFYLWFFGASGSAGIGRKAFPAFLEKETEKQNLAELGPTLGGDDFGLSPFCVYPKDLKTADVETIVSLPLTVEQIVSKYPVENNFLSAKGYLTFEAYKRYTSQDSGCNPLAVRAIFDTLNCNSNVCEPDKAQTALDSYKQDINAIKSGLLVATATRFGGIFALILLLFLADWQAFIVHAFAGWLPEWPGFDDFPSSFFDPETGIQAIPKYYMWDIPMDV
jgi:hypothetical protein